MSARLDAVNAATTAAQVAANVALRFFRRDIFNLHDRLQQNRFALLEAIFHGENRRQLKRQLAGIDFVEAAVNDVDLNIDHGMTAGMYSRGIMPPTILFSTTRPLPRSAGRTSTSTCPY